MDRRFNAQGRVQPGRELFDFDRSITAYSSNEAMSLPVKKESDAKHNDGCLCGTSKFQDAVMVPRRGYAANDSYETVVSKA